MKLLGTKLRMSSAFHPQTDGQTERANDIVETTLRIYAAHQPTSWDEHLPIVEFTSNNTKSTATGFTPFYLTYGYHPDTPIDLLYQRAM